MGFSKEKSATDNNSTMLEDNLRFTNSINHFLTFKAPGFIYKKWKADKKNQNASTLFHPLERDKTAFQFSRTRSVSLPWSELIGTGFSDVATDIQFLRNALENSWGCKPYDDDRAALSRYIVKTCSTYKFEYLLPKLTRPDLKGSCNKARWNLLPEGATIILYGDEFYFIRPKYAVKSFSIFDNNGSLRDDWESDIERVFIARPRISCPLHRFSKWTKKTDFGINRHDNFSCSIKQVPTPLQLRDNIRLLKDKIKPENKIYFLTSGNNGHDFIKNIKKTIVNDPCDFDPRLPFKIPDCRPQEVWERDKIDNGKIILVYGVHSASNLSNEHIVKNTRYFLVNLLDNKTLTTDELTKVFSEKKEYEAFWNTISSLSMVFHNSLADEEITRRITHGFEIANTYRAILDEFCQLDAERQVYAGTKNAEPVIDPFEPGFDLKVARLSAVKRRSGMLDIQIARLRAKAASLGLILATENVDNNEDKVKERLKAAGVPDDLHYKVLNNVATLKKGRLYKLGVRQFEEWSTYEVFNVPKRVGSSSNGILGIGGSSSSSWVTVQETREVKHRFDYQPIAEVAMDLEPWRDAKARLELAGWVCHVFRLSDEGFVSQLDQTIETTMALCEANENYRGRCAIFFPVYEESLIKGEPILTKYIVTLAPLPGITTIRAPQIYIEEEFDYRIAWLGSELGELAGSTNLAPGETKSITVTRSYSTSIEESRSSSSSQEVTSARSSDIATMIENEATSNSKLGTSSGFNAKVSGTYKAVTGDMGTDNRSNLNAEAFSRYFQSVAKKATENVSRAFREEVSFTSNTSSKSEVTETVTGQISNINQGKTLNLLFYRVKNVFEGSLHFRKIRITVIGGRELVAGTGFTSSKTFDFGDADQALDYLVSDEVFLKMFGIDPFNLKYAAAKAILSTIEREYVEKNKRDCSSEGAVDAHEMSIERFAQPDAMLKVHLNQTQNYGETLEAIVNGRFRNLRESSKQIEDEPLVRDVFYLPSGALYLDAMVGVRNATEEYAERMRERELQVKSASIRKETADALLAESKAYAIRKGDSLCILKEPKIKGAPYITKEGTLVVKLTSPLPAGSWYVEINGIPHDFIAEQVGRKEIEISGLDSDPGNLVTAISNQKVRLVDAEKGTLITVKKSWLDFK